MRYYDSMQVGEVQHSGETYLLTEEEIIEVGTRWDPQPFHIDPKASEDSIFGGLVASSVHLFAIMIRLAQTYPGEKVAALSALGFDAIRLQTPARPGDVLRCKDTTMAKRLSKSRPGCGIVESRAEVSNQAGEICFSATSALLIQCRDGVD